MSLNSLSNRKRSDFSSSDNFELIEMGLDFYGSMPKSISSNSSLAITCVSSLAAVLSSTFLSFFSFESSRTTKHTRDPC